MQTKIIITLLIIISLGISYFVYQDFSEKRTLEKAREEREEKRKKWREEREEKKRQAKLKDQQRKKEYGKCYELWNLSNIKRDIYRGWAESGVPEVGFSVPTQKDRDLVDLYKECGDRPESW